MNSDIIKKKINDKLIPIISPLGLGSDKKLITLMVILRLGR